MCSLAFEYNCSLMQQHKQQQQQQQQQQQARKLIACVRRKCRRKRNDACRDSMPTASAKTKSKTTPTPTTTANLQTNDNYYCNFNKINKLLIATCLLLLITSATTICPSATAAAIASMPAAAVLKSAASAATVPLSPVQQRQLQQQQLFALLTKNGQAGGTAAGTAAAAAALSSGGHEQHELEADLDAATSLETAGFVADDGQQYEKAVRALAAATINAGNSNKSGRGDNNGAASGRNDNNCPKECKCLNDYFDCGDKRLDRIPELPNYVQTLDLVGNKLNDTTVLQIRNLTEMTKLSLKRNQLENMPIFMGLSSLKHLNLANNHIQRIDRAALTALPKLKALDLSRNYLHTIELSYFPPINRLAHLLLNTNEIANIDGDAFQNLTDLLDLELNNNRLMTLPAGVFSQLHKLRKLSLNNNQLEINYSTFRGLQSLQKLFLKSNNIRALQDGVFFQLHEVETIELDHNSITSLSRQGLFNLTKLHHLSLSNNSITRIEPDTWEFTQSLVSLDLSHNNISEFKPQHLDCLKRLRQLNLGHNKIQYLAENTFDCVKNLEDLNLRRNKLAWIIEDQGATPAFKALRKLKKLDLYGNNLKQIMSKSLSGLSSLESFNLGGNALATIQSAAFDHMPLLQKLSFKSLNFICDCELLWFQRWLRRNAQSQQAANAVCGYPEHLLDRQLLSLSDAELVCADTPKPIITQEPSNQLTVKGANITMECIGNSPAAASLAAADELKIKWRHDNQNIREREVRAGSSLGVASVGSYSTTETQIHHDQSTNQTTIIGYLRLYNVSYANAGRYQCVVSNAFGTTYSQKFKISIGIHPTFLQIPSNLTIDSGDTARLVCSATGDPIPEIALQKFGGSDFPAATERRLQVVREENAFIITNAKPIDTGIYTCTAESAAGEIKVNATIIVNDKPQADVPLMRKEVALGESSVLECLSDMAAELSQPFREWFKDNKLLHTGQLNTDAERYFFTAEKKLLVIVNASSSDAGQYRCEIRDNSKTFIVQTELIVVKEVLNQTVLIVGIVLVTVVCILVGSLIVCIILYYHRRKAYARGSGGSSGGGGRRTAHGGAIIMSSGVGSGGGVGGARVASTSPHLLSNSRGSSTLDQTQLTTLNRTYLQKPSEQQRQRPHSFADLDLTVLSARGPNDVQRVARTGNGAPAEQQQRLLVNHTPSYQQLLPRGNGSSGGGEHLTLEFLKRNSLHDADHQQDHLSSKDSGTGSDTAVKRSIDDFTLTALLAPVGASQSSPIGTSTPAVKRINGARATLAQTDTLTDDDGGDDVDDVVDNAEMVFAATHALGVSEYDVDLLDEHEHEHDERTRFLHNNNKNNNPQPHQSQRSPNAPVPPLLYNHNYNNSHSSHNSFDGDGVGVGLVGGGRVGVASPIGSASSSKCKANLSTNTNFNSNSVAAGICSQAVDI